MSKIEIKIIYLYFLSIFQILLELFLYLSIFCPKLNVSEIEDYKQIFIDIISDTIKNTKTRTEFCKTYSQLIINVI